MSRGASGRRERLVFLPDSGGGHRRLSTSACSSGRSCSRLSCAASVLAFSRFAVAAKMAACTASAEPETASCLTCSWEYTLSASSARSCRSSASARSVRCGRLCGSRWISFSASFSIVAAWLFRFRGSRRTKQQPRVGFVVLNGEIVRPKREHIRQDCMNFFCVAARLRQPQPAIPCEAQPGRYRCGIVIGDLGDFSFFILLGVLGECD